MNLVNLEDMMEKLRVVKSAEEIAALDKAAKLGDLMLARLPRHARGPASRNARSTPA